MNRSSSDGELREEVESLVVIATGRVVSLDDLRACDGSLTMAGINSIAYINLIEALERRYNVVADVPQAASALTSVDGIVGLIRAAQVPESDGPGDAR